MGTKTGIQIAVDHFDGSCQRLADAIGGGVRRQKVEHWLKVGRVPAEWGAAVETATQRATRRWDLCPKDWARIWPELVGVEGAPPVTASVERA